MKTAEGELQSALGVRYAFAMAGVEAGFAAALAALGLGPGDRVWCSPFAPVSLASACERAGVTLDFIDVDAASRTVSTLALSERLEEAARSGRTPKVVVASHHHGHPAELYALNHLANLYGYYLVEDASQALGAYYGEFPIGSCRYGDMVVLALGEAALVTTNSEAWARSLAEWAVPLGEPAHVAFAEREEARYRREAVAGAYDEALASTAVGLPVRNPDHRSALSAYAVTVDAGDRERLLASLQAAGVGASRPEPLLRLASRPEPLLRLASLPVAEDYAATAIALPLESEISAETIARLLT